MLAYKVSLEHLRTKELTIGCREALKVCGFIPKAHEILAGLAAYRERMSGYGHSPVLKDTDDPMTQEEREAIGQLIIDAGKRLKMAGKK